MMRYILAVCILALTSFPCRAQEIPEGDASEQPLSSSFMPTDFPGSTAVFLQSSRLISWDGGRSSAEEIRNQIRILRPEGVEKFGDFGLFFRKGEQTVDVLRAGSYAPGSREFRPVPKDRLVDRPAAGKEESVLFPDLLYRSVPFEDLAVGSTLETRLKRTSLREFEGISGIEYFRSDEPFLGRQLNIVVPQGTRLLWKIQNGDTIRLMKVSARGGDLYSFRAQESLPAPRVPLLPPYSSFAPRVLFTTFGSWREAAAPFLKGWEAAIGNRNGVPALVNRILAGETREEARIRKVFEYLAREVRGLDVSLSQVGWAVRSASSVLDSRAGNRLDLAALAAAMLEEAGFRVTPALANSRGSQVEETMPLLEQFDTILLRVEGQSGARYLEPYPSGATFPGSWPEGTRCLLCRKDSCSLATLDGPAPEASSAGRTMRLVLDAVGGAEMEVEYVLEGGFGAQARRLLADIPPDRRERFLAGSVLRENPSALFRRGDMAGLEGPSGPVRIRIACRLPELAIRRGGFATLVLPGWPVDLGRVRIPDRPASVEVGGWLGEPAQSSETWDVTLPEGVEVLRKPEPAEKNVEGWALRRETSGNTSHSLRVRVESGTVSRVLPASECRRAASFLGELFPEGWNVLILKWPQQTSGGAK